MTARIDPEHVAALVRLLDGEPRWPVGTQVRALQDAIATEARRAATGNTDAVEDEGAGRRHCPKDTGTPLDREGE